MQFDENYWREGQRSERADLKDNGFFIAHLSLKCFNLAILINARRPSSVISRVSVLCRRIFALIWQIYIKSLDAS